MAYVSGGSAFDNKPSSSSLVFEEFVPPAAWTEDSTCHYLHVDLPDFKRQDLKLQVDNKTYLIVSGEKQVRENKYKRFEQRFKLPKNADTENITGKLDGQILYISVPKKIEHQHQEMKHDNISSPKPVSDSDSDESDNKDGEDDDDQSKSDTVNKDESDNKDGEKELEKEEDAMYFDEKWGHEGGLFPKLAMEELKNSKGVVVIAIFAFLLGVLVTQKVQ